MKDIKKANLLIEAAKQMDIISHEYCNMTQCTNERMKAVEGELNCEWYHGGWMYCRLAGIVVSEDYLGKEYERFFIKHINSKRINILVCGLADFAILEHIIRRIPNKITNKIHITILDICNSPLKLCDWYLKKCIPTFLSHVDYVVSDATKLPFEDNTFDLITSYSFLTRMIYNMASKVVNEWERVLKKEGNILTTVHIFTSLNHDGDFYISPNADKNYALKKADEFILLNEIDDALSLIMKNKVKKYVSNIMSVAMSEEKLKTLFSNFQLEFTYFDQPGELEDVHNMIIVNAKKR